MIDSERANAPRIELNWAASKSIGGISEIAVLAPIRLGCPPGERRTYEECTASAIQNLADRHQQGLPTELSRIPAIHFGRMIIIRPEQYLLYSDLPGFVDYYPDGKLSDGGGIPAPIDDYLDRSRKLAAGADLSMLEGTIKEYADALKAKGEEAANRMLFEQIRRFSQVPPPKLRSFLLTLVEFDGELKAYMRDIAEFLARDFDRVFENCEGFPGTRNFEQFWLWIRRYQINTNLFYAPYSNLSTVRIKQLEDFKRRFDALVARIYSPPRARERSVEELFDEFLRQSEQYARNFPTPGGIFETDRS
jgi:hypothetical protein